jgi:hypothetical protein
MSMWLLGKTSPPIRDAGQNMVTVVDRNGGRKRGAQQQVQPEARTLHALTDHVRMQGSEYCEESDDGQVRHDPASSREMRALCMVSAAAMSFRPAMVIVSCKFLSACSQQARSARRTQSRQLHIQPPAHCHQYAN